MILTGQISGALYFGIEYAKTESIKWKINFISVEGDEAMTMSAKKFLLLVGYYTVLIAAMVMFANQPIFS
ncbi:MAG: hypothetical protein H8E42_03790 [Nitrospinae bacterium]|nr:hypothetical protein [Nitrospinota bacterium]